MTPVEIISSPSFWIGCFLGVIISQIIINIIIRKLEK